LYCSCILNVAFVLQFLVGEDVWLMNPKRSTQKVASGKISGIGREHKFYFKEIPEKWFKVDVQEALLPKTALMQPNEDADQHVVGDVVGTAVIWDQKHLKIVR
jgi:hypothetical protein